MIVLKTVVSHDDNHVFLLFGIFSKVDYLWQHKQKEKAITNQKKQHKQKRCPYLSNWIHAHMA